MAEPKKRMTSSRSGNRKSKIFIKTKSVSVCPKCKSPYLPHRVCPTCGFYKNVDILKLEEKAAAKEKRRKEKEEEEAKEK